MFCLHVFVFYYTTQLLFNLKTSKIRQEFKKLQAHVFLKREICGYQNKDWAAFVVSFISIKEDVLIYRLFTATGLTMLLPYIISTRSKWVSCQLRVFALVNRQQESEIEERKWVLREFTQHSIGWNLFVMKWMGITWVGYGENGGERRRTPRKFLWESWRIDITLKL